MTEKKGFLVVSDLHLSEGRDPGSGWTNPKEDFLFDQDFADFLEYHLESRQEIAWTLIFAGDFLDFLQVTETPKHRRDLESENDYGLVSGPEESAWKLRRIIRGHPILFKALSSFAAKHRIIFISGNHDAEFFFPEVRAALIEGLRETANNPDHFSDLENRIIFSPWFWFERGIYVEHGHQYDPLNTFPSALNPVCSPTGRRRRDRARIYLPLGSIFVRYLFNRVEVSSPDADNIKPPTRFIGWFIRNHPIRAIFFLTRDGKKMIEIIQEHRRRVLA